MADYLDSGRRPIDEQWQHVAGTYDGRTARFYLDGAEVASRLVFGGQGTSNIWRIGAYERKCFRGAIDDVRIYNRALSGAEIAADMASPIS
jgi:hypothetical protein